MKNRLFYTHFSLLLFALLLSSCTKEETVNIDYTFTATLNNKADANDFNTVDFKEFENLNLGFYKGNLWIKLEVNNGNKANSYMIINNDNFNRKYAFYKLDTFSNSLKLVKQTTDLTKRDYRTFNFPNPNFKIDLAPQEQATFVLLTSSDGRTINATPQLISMESYSAFISKTMIWSVTFMGLIVFLLIVNIYQWKLHKQKIHLYYIFYMLATFLMYLGFEGYLYSLGLKIIIIDHVIFIAVRLWILCLILFTTKFLDTKAVAPKYFNKFILWLLFIVLGGTTIYQLIFFNSSIAHLHYFDNTLSFLWLGIILITILVSAKSRKLELRYYLISLSLFLLFITLGLINGHFQIFPGNPFIYIKIGTMVEFIGFTYFMTVLIKRKLDRGENLDNEIEKTKNLKKELEANKDKLIHTSKELKEKEAALSNKKGIEKTDVIGILKLLENSLSTDEEWEEFKLKFTALNPNFLEQLSKKHPDLTKSEIRLLTLIKIGYTQKEIADILSIAPDSVKKSRSRARKKLKLQKSVSLSKYLSKF
ncbi:MAG: 7TM diverse intracellular signaling domain-containing protein [Chitinophagales bacterium]